MTSSTGMFGSSRATGTVVDGAIKFQMARDGKLSTVSAEEIFDRQSVVVFAVVSAFAPECSNDHTSGFLELESELLTRVSKIVCLVWNNPWVVQAWKDELLRHRSADSSTEIMFLPDARGALTRLLGLEREDPDLGTRSRRSAMYLENKVVKKAFVEDEGINVTSAQFMLKYLDCQKNIYEDKGWEDMLLQKPLMVDTRTDSEFAEKAIPEAVLLTIRMSDDPIQKLQGWDKLPEDKGAPILVFCAVGGRSGRAAEAMRALGYTNVKNGGGVDEVAQKLQEAQASQVWEI